MIRSKNRISKALQLSRVTWYISRSVLFESFNSSDNGEQKPSSNAKKFRRLKYFGNCSFPSRLHRAPSEALMILYISRSGLRKDTGFTDSVLPSCETSSPEETRRMRCAVRLSNNMCVYGMCSCIKPYWSVRLILFVMIWQMIIGYNAIAVTNLVRGKVPEDRNRQRRLGQIGCMPG